MAVSLCGGVEMIETVDIAWTAGDPCDGSVQAPTVNQYY